MYLGNRSIWITASYIFYHLSTANSLKFEVLYVIVHKNMKYCVLVDDNFTHGADTKLF